MFDVVLENKGKKAGKKCCLKVEEGKKFRSSFSLFDRPAATRRRLEEGQERSRVRSRERSREWTKSFY